MFGNLPTSFKHSTHQAPHWFKPAQGFKRAAFGSPVDPLPGRLALVYPLQHGTPTFLV